MMTTAETTMTTSRVRYLYLPHYLLSVRPLAFSWFRQAVTDSTSARAVWPLRHLTFPAVMIGEVYGPQPILLL